MTENTPLCRFRAGRLEDVERLAALETRAHAFPWSRAQIRDCLIARYDCWLCELPAEGEGVQETIAGYAIVSRVLDEASLLTLCVDPSWQGRGLGRRLLAFAMEEAKTRGAARLFLEVRASNARAISLYESCAFQRIGRRKDYYQGRNAPEDALVYSRPL